MRAHHAEDGGDVDDCAVSRRRQVGDRILAAEERAAQVDRDDPIPVRGVQRVRRQGVAGDACVVDQDRQTVHRRAADHLPHARFIRHIAGDEPGPAAARGDEPHRLLARVILAIRHDDCGPLVREAKRDGPADARRRAGHDGGTS